MRFIETTLPSDYDLDRGWSMTIGKLEYEAAAREITEYLQDNGNVWREVPVCELPYFGRYIAVNGMASMPEGWLKQLQRVRRPRPGPPELIFSQRAKGNLQLRYPNGQVLAAAHEYTDLELKELLAERFPK